MKTNPVLDAIRNRRSVRTYDPRPLPADVLATIVEAGTLAPTGMNAQTFHFTVIQDAEKPVSYTHLDVYKRQPRTHRTNSPPS